MIAALFVETNGCYFNLDEVDPWDIERDARKYTGPHPVVAHPPCQRWGKYWHGAPNKPHQFRKGEDAGCFGMALTAVRNYSGVIEHPAHSHAWEWFGLSTPPRTGWGKADRFGGVTCYVEQGHYGHLSRKGTWLYSVGCGTPDMHWGPSEQKIHPVALAKHGYEKARRIGMMAMIGGKDKTILRNATPPLFRDALINMASNAKDHRGGTMNKSQEEKPWIAAPVNPLVGQSICPVCNKPIDDADLSSTGYIDYHKECNLVS